MDGTIYCKHYQISSEQSTESTSTSDDASDQLAFASLCATRAHQLGMDDRDRALSSRMMLEQARILTTHNMVTLFVTFDLHERLDELDVPAILQRCWHRIHAMIANTMTTPGITPAPVQRERATIGELWWQMVFYLAVLEKFGSAKCSKAVNDVTQVSWRLTVVRMQIQIVRGHTDSESAIRFVRGRRLP